ncbi:ABC di/peptide transporter substrate-binding protein [Aliidongia dinghuensis]|uniref:ABC di/peptide transporter substrate-binding protein n=1 Tax=Aliidongia dinghuensis TaxID=1867774 RepID=A0A8J2YXP7_9PROT|nr:ABC transporter substrate-binding protein [Aliidongia dinghuensis]GGF37600.1 ABC di/peptide transporter substrate-binding protein [Aliidongia dinghuensis]
MKANIDRRRFGVAALAAALLTLGTPVLAQTRGGDVVVAQQAQPPSLDAMTTFAQAARNITMHVFETLYTRGETGAVIPELATDETTSPDLQTYTFHLRKGVKFHNGKEMTGVDVKASLERYAKVGASAQLLATVSGIDVPDPYTVVVHLKQPVPAFLDFISTPRAPMVIMPAEEAAKEPNKIALIGTGPYQFVEYKPDSYVKLKRFDGYVPNGQFSGPDGFGGKKTPYFDTVTFRFMPESGARAAALQTGEVQALEQLAVADAERLKTDQNVKLYQMMPWAFQVFFLNANDGPTKNLKFREAVRAALGNEEIMAIATDGLFRLTHGWQHPGTEYFAGDVGKDKYNLNDPELAKRLLKEAGYKGEPFTLVTDNSFKNDNDASVVASQQLQAVGINVKLQVADWPTSIAMRQKPVGWNMFPIFIGVEPWEGPYSTTTFFTGKDNWQQHVDSELEADADKLNSSPSLDDRKAAFAAFQQRLIDQVYAIKLGDLGIYQATRANVANYKPFRIPRMWDVWFK